MLFVWLLAQSVSTAAAVPAGATPPNPQLAAHAVPETPAKSEHAYYGHHPVPDGLGTFCISTGPHKHPFAPFEPTLFVSWDGNWVFVGDPYAFGYAGPAHQFWNHHPHPWGGWCYYYESHHHLYDGWGTYFHWVGAYYVYGGAFDRDYYRGYGRHSPIYRRARPPWWGPGAWAPPVIAPPGHHGPRRSPTRHVAPSWRRKKPPHP